MKAVVFTIDAIFAMIIAGVAITMLIYFSYTPQTPFLASYSDTHSILNILSSTTVAQIAVTNNNTASQMVNQYNSKSNSWQEYADNSERSSYSGSGPQSQSISFIYNLPSQQNAQPVAGHGNIYLASGNYLIALNASSGVTSWKTEMPTQAESLALYNNMLIYWNASSWIVARSAVTGTTLWQTHSDSNFISQILINGKYGVVGTSSNSINFYNLDNGSLANPYAASESQNSISLAVIYGSIASRTSYNGIQISGISVEGKSAGLPILIEPSPIHLPATTNITVSQGLIAFGSNNQECATYSNTMEAFCFSTGLGSVSSVSSSGSMFIYQTSNSIIGVSTSGSLIWQVPFDLKSSPNLAPVVSSGVVYSGWSNGEIIAQRISTGSPIWMTQSIYGPITEMILAYGRLYAISGEKLIAYGSCQGDSQSSILLNAANLYANGDGSCAAYLLNSVYQLSNYTLTLNNTLQGAERIPYFNGTNSYMIGNITSLPTEPQLTITAWVDPSGYQPSGCGSECGIVAFGNRECPGLGRMLGLNDPNPSPTASNDMMYVSMSAWCQNYAPEPGPTVNDNQWNFIAMVMNGASITLYANSNSISGNIITMPGSINSENLSIGMEGYPGSLFPSNTFNGSIANVQIYNTPFQPNQISELYEEGLNGGPVSGLGIVSWYPLDGNTNDYGPYNNTLYPVNIIYQDSGYRPSSYLNSFSTSKSSVVVPVSSYVADFNGTTSYISTNALGLPLGSSGRSVFAWVYFRGPSGSCTTTSPKYSIYGFGTPATTNQFSGLLLCGSQLYFAGWNNDAKSTFSLTPDTWNFVGYAYTKGSSSVTLYLNGSFQILPLSSSLNTQPYVSDIGGIISPGFQGYYFNGSIANVQVYNLTVSSPSAADLYSEGVSGLPLNGYNLVGWWPLNGHSTGYAIASQAVSNDINYSYVPNLYNVGIVSWR